MLKFWAMIVKKLCDSGTISRGGNIIMMQIEKDSRQIPRKQEICSNKLYSDIVYGWFQEMSEVDSEGIRYIKEKNINYSAIAKTVKLSRQTVAKRIKNLEEIGLIYKNEMKKRYEIHLLSKLDASLIPNRTLTFLVDSYSENAISIYIYLLNRFWANNEQPFIFLIDQVKNFLGISTNTTSNNHCVMNPIYSMINDGLIEVEVVQKNGIKSLYQVTRMSFDFVKNLDTKVVKNLDNVAC